jgi:hypothetical protein
MATARSKRPNQTGLNNARKLFRQAKQLNERACAALRAALPVGTAVLVRKISRSFTATMAETVPNGDVVWVFPHRLEDVPEHLREFVGPAGYAVGIEEITIIAPRRAAPLPRLSRRPREITVNVVSTNRITSPAPMLRLTDGRASSSPNP